MVALQNIMLESYSNEALQDDQMGLLAALLIQGVIYIALNILIDYLRTVHYRGLDGNAHRIVERMQLDERPDV